MGGGWETGNGDLGEKRGGRKKGSEGGKGLAKDLQEKSFDTTIRRLISRIMLAIQLLETRQFEFHSRRANDKRKS